VFARLLPYVEQAGVYQLVDFKANATSQSAVMSQRIAVYFCPSDPNDRLAPAPLFRYPATYGAIHGEWLGNDYNAARFGNGPFPGAPYPSQRGLRLADITDGTSGTVGFAEVKAFSPFLAAANTVPPATPPATPAEVIAFGGTLSRTGGHNSWADALTHQTGITVTFAPNTLVPYRNPSDGLTYDVDWGCGGYVQSGAFTARSYHTGGVNTLFVDGSVRFVTNSIPQMTWRALGTHNGGEVVDATAY
jgi:prepilin-type processing-associated H-X9-DG protein